MRLRTGVWLAAMALGPAAWSVANWVSPEWVERSFSVGIGQQVASAQGVLVGWVPFSVVELVVVGGGGALVVALVRGMRRASRAAWARTWLPGLLAGASVLYAAFVFGWALNYRRPPLIERLGYAPGAPSEDEVRALATEAVADANAAREGVREDEAGVAALPGSIAETITRAQEVYDAASRSQLPFLSGTYSRAKPFFFATVASYWGMGGVYSPFTGEPNVNVAGPVFDLPFAICHELAHQRGVAREDEANFVAYVVGRDFGDAVFRYSAVLHGASYAANALMRTDPEAGWALWESLSPAVKRDLAVREQWREQHDTAIGDFGKAMNSGYLKSNGVKDGVASYGRIVDLMVAERRPRR